MTDALSIARDLLRCPSVTPADAGALGVVEKILSAAGFEVHRITFGEPGTADIDNLYARIGSTAPHITFAGHTDVVPPGDESAWSHGAFSGDVKDGFLYGRGAVDMKGGIACSVAAVLEHLAAHGGKPREDGNGSISFLITGDEEDISVNGTIKLLQWAATRGEKFDHCVLGEPSNVEQLGDCIKVGRRGSQSGTLYVDGIQGHVAYPQRASNPVPDISRLILALSEEPLDHGSAHFEASNLEFTSVDVGNTASNVIPGQARATTAGEAWRQYRNGPLTKYGGWLFIAALFSVAATYFLRGRLMLKARSFIMHPFVFAVTVAQECRARQGAQTMLWTSIRCSSGRPQSSPHRQGRTRCVHSPSAALLWPRPVARDAGDGED